MPLKKLVGIIIILLIFITFSHSLVFAERSMVYFYSPTCGSCMQTKDIVYYVQTIYPDLEVIELSTSDPEIQVILEEYGEKYNVEDTYIGLVPAVFYGEHGLVGYDAIDDRLEELLKNPMDTPGPGEISAMGTEDKIIDRFRAFNIGTVLVAGLVDGINPCAFSTLIFFISFLVVSGQTGKKILYVGSSFTFGIFVSYLLMGWGLFRLMDSLQGITRIARFIYPVTAILVTILAIVSFIDYLKVLRKQHSKMSLTLPKAIVRLIHKVVHKLMNLGFLIPVSFLVGVLISFLEFLCTGQIYLPTIVYITGVDTLRIKALFYLVLYNLSFVLPMIIILIAAYKTNTSRIVAEYLNTRLKGIKLVATGLFVLLGCYMWVLTFKFF